MKTADKILKRHEDENEHHFHTVDRKWIIEAMEEYHAQFTAEVEGVSDDVATKLLKSILTIQEDVEKIINATPSGKNRNDLTEVNIRMLYFNIELTNYLKDLPPRPSEPVMLNKDILHVASEKPLTDTIIEIINKMSEKAKQYKFEEPTKDSPSESTIDISETKPNWKPPAEV